MRIHEQCKIELFLEIRKIYTCADLEYVIISHAIQAFEAKT